MKILHVCDIASVGKLISRELVNEFDVNSVVLSRRELDVFHFGMHYANVTKNHTGRVRKFAFNVVRLARKFDIIHVHAWDKCVPYLRKIFPKKPIVMHYHGGDIRENWESKRERFQHADFIAVSTPHLLDDKPEDVKAQWIPNPVDVEHFTRLEESVPNSALFIRQHFDEVTPSEIKATEIAVDLDLDLTILNREHTKYPYTYFPRYLEKFEMFLDYKHGRRLAKDELAGMSPILEDMSLTALQQLALGGLVHHNDEVYNVFPDEHDSFKVAFRWLGIYCNLLE